jgi:hypothetical protein
VADQVPESEVQRQLAQARLYLKGQEYLRSVDHDPDDLRSKSEEELRWYLGTKNRFQDDGRQITRAEQLLVHKEGERRERRERRGQWFKLAVALIALVAAVVGLLAHLI